MPLRAMRTRFDHVLNRVCVCLHRVEVLELLRAIACDACSLEAGRRWSVALIRQGNHIEYGRLPSFMVRVQELVWVWVCVCVSVCVV